jgi:acyl carrier protein
MNSELKAKIFSVIRKDMSVDPATVDPDMPIRDQISLDSMQFVSLTARLEVELNIELPVSIMQVRTLNEFLAVIERNFPQTAH